MELTREIIVCNTYRECMNYIKGNKLPDAMILLSDACKESNIVKCISIFDYLDWRELRRVDWVAYNLLRRHGEYLKDFSRYKFYKYLKYIFDSVYSHYTPISRILRRVFFLGKIIKQLQPSNTTFVNIPFLIIPWNTIEEVNISMNIVYNPIDMFRNIIFYYEPLILPEFKKIVKHRLGLYIKDRNSAKPIMTPYVLQLWYDTLLYLSSIDRTLLLPRRLVRDVMFNVLHNLSPKYYIITDGHDRISDIHEIDIAFVATFANSVRTAFPLVKYFRDRSIKIIGVVTHIDGLFECQSKNIPYIGVGNFASKVISGELKRIMLSIAKKLYLYFIDNLELERSLFKVLKPALIFHSILAIPYGMSLILGFKEFFESACPRAAVSFDDIGFAGRLFIYVAREHKIRTVTFQHSVIDDILRYKDTIADFMCVWGDYCKDLLAMYGVPVSKLVTVGPLRNIKINNKGISVNMDRVLDKHLVISWFPTKFIDTDAHMYINKRELLCILNSINSFIKKYNWNVAFIIKIHPQDESYFYEKILHMVKNKLHKKLRDNIVILDVPIEKVIDKTDLVLTTNSTSSIEAILSGKIIGYMNCSDIEETLPLVRYGAAIPVRRSDDLVNLLETYTDVTKLNALISRLERGKREFMRQYLNNGILNYERIRHILLR